MIYLGDFLNNPLRIGAWSMRSLLNGRKELGIVVANSVELFRLGADVSLSIDGLAFAGQVILAEPWKGLLSGGEVQGTHLILEGAFT